MPNTRTAPQITNFDLFRIEKAKLHVDICSNTIREYCRQGLQKYKRGKATFISRAELEEFIKAEQRQPRTRQ